VDALALLLEAAVAPAARSVNLWGALGCAVAYSAALLATLDAFADLVLVRSDSATGRLSPGLSLKFGSKIVAAVITVVAAAMVLALDGNWFAFTSLSVAFLAVIGVAGFVMIRQVRVDQAAAASRSGGSE
jgi:hypothetical protein